MELQKLKELLTQEEKAKEQTLANLNALIGSCEMLKRLIADEENNLKEIKKDS